MVDRGYRNGAGGRPGRSGSGLLSCGQINIRIVSSLTIFRSIIRTEASPKVAMTFPCGNGKGWPPATGLPLLKSFPGISISADLVQGTAVAASANRNVLEVPSGKLRGMAAGVFLSGKTQSGPT